MRATLPLWAEQIAVFDTETTGISTAHSRIVTASIAVLTADGQVTERYDWMLNPGVEIPDTAVQVHGITTKMARSQGMDAEVGVHQIVTQLINLSGRGLPIVIYNAPYDLTLLAHEALRHGIDFPEDLAPILDPLVIDKQVDRYRRGKRTLIAVSAHYGVDLSLAHDAGADAIAAGQVLQALALQYGSSLPSDAHSLHEQQVKWAASQAQSFQTYMREQRDPNFVVDDRWPLQMPS